MKSKQTLKTENIPPSSIHNKNKNDILKFSTNPVRFFLLSGIHPSHWIVWQKSWYLFLLPSPPAPVSGLRRNHTIWLLTLNVSLARRPNGETVPFILQQHFIETRAVRITIIIHKTRLVFFYIFKFLIIFWVGFSVFLCVYSSKYFVSSSRVPTGCLSSIQCKLLITIDFVASLPESFVLLVFTLRVRFLFLLKLKETRQRKYFSLL